MSEQDIPNQRPEVFREELEEDYGIVVSADRIVGFVNTIMSNLGGEYVPPSEEDTKAAAAFLLELVQAGKYGDSWNDYKKRIGVRKIHGPGSGFNPEFVRLNSPELSVVVEYLDGKSSYDAAVLQLAQMHGRKESTAKKWIEAIRPRAENVLALREWARIRRAERSKNSEK